LIFALYSLFFALYFNKISKFDVCHPIILFAKTQEPALLILSLEGFEYENLGQILEWSPTVIVQQDIYELADSLSL